MRDTGTNLFDQLEALSAKINNRIDYINTLLSDEHLSEDLKENLRNRVDEMLWELHQLSKAVSDKTKSTDTVFMQQLVANTETAF